MAVDVNEFDGIALNVLGVDDLVNSDTNKSKLGVYTNLEGKSGDEVDLLSLDMDEEELIKLSKEREIQYAGYEARIRPIQKTNKAYYLGKQSGNSSQTPLAANLLFEAVETFLAAALSKNPEPVVYSDNTEEGNQLSSDIKTMLQYHAKTLVLRKKLAAMVRQWTINHLGVLKYGWDDEIQEVKLEIRKIQNFIFDPTCSPDAYGDFESWLGERVTITAKKLVELFPKHKEYISTMVDGKMGTEVTYTEWWEDDITYCTFKDIVLDKSKNPHFNYPKDEDGEFNIPVTKDGVNHFAKPKKPYVFLSVFSMGDQPHDITGLIEQNIPQQNLISKRTYQIDRNINVSNNSIALSEDNFNQQTGKQAAVALETGDPILVPPGRPINEAIIKFTANSLPSEFFQDTERNENNLRSIFGVQGITAQQPNEDTTARGMILSQQYDNSRIGGGVGDSIEQVAETVFNGLVQMYYVYYDEQHFAAVMGQLQATEYVVLSNDKFSNGGVPLRLIVTVAPDSTKPKDELTQMNQALQLWTEKALDIKTLLTILNFPDPQKTAGQVWLYQTNPQLYGQMNFKELMQDMAQFQQGQPQNPGGQQPGGPTPQPQQPANPQPEGVPANDSLSAVPLPQ